MVAQLALAIEILTGVSPISGAYEVVERGNGPEITKWDESVLGPMPTEAQIDAAYDAWTADAPRREALIELERSDSEDMPRLAEDILDMLLANGLLTIDNLPNEAARAKWQARKNAAAIARA